MLEYDNYQIYASTRKSQFDDSSDISKENLINENMETKLKMRKSKLQNKINTLRKKLSANKNLNSNSDLSLFINAFNFLSDNEIKKNIISLLIDNNLSQVVEILKKNTNLNFEKTNEVSSSELLLNLIELDISNENNILYIISNKTQNIENIIKILQNISNEELLYDSFYIMISGNLMLYDEKTDNLIRKNVNLSKIFDLIKKNDTINSYSYIFFLYAYLYRLDTKKLELYENNLVSLIEMIQNKNLNYLYEDIYDILIIFSNVYSFNKFFFANYQLLFGDKDFDINDKLLVSKLSMINNIFTTLSSQEILYYLNIKNNDSTNTNNIINLVLNSLTNLSQINSNNIFNNNMQIILLSLKVLLTLSFHKELTNSLLENKIYMNLLMNIFNNFLNDTNNLINNNIIYYENQMIVVMMIINNIIKNEYYFFISLLINNNIHLKINKKFNFFLSNKINLNEEIFVSLLDIIISLFDNEKKARLKTEIIKMDLNNNGLYDNILGIMKKFGVNSLINQKCTNFLEVYYPEQSQIQMNIIELTNFKFINLGI